jgi:hypothetical protein
LEHFPKVDANGRKITAPKTRHLSLCENSGIAAWGAGLAVVFQGGDFFEKSRPEQAKER